MRCSPFHAKLILVEGLAASRRELAAISIDRAGYGIEGTGSGVQPTRDLPEFLFTENAGAGAAQYAIGFLQIRHAMLSFPCRVEGGKYKT